MDDQLHDVWDKAHDLFDRLRDGRAPDFRAGQDGLKALLLPSSGGQPPDYVIAGGRDESRPADAFLGREYFLTALLDELFVGPESAWHERWNTEKLEWWLYKSNDRAWRFWQQVGAVERHPAGDGLEVALAAVLLGFRGDLRERPDDLRDWVGRTAAFLDARHQVRRPPRRDDGEPPTDVPARRPPSPRPAPAGLAAEAVGAAWRKAVKALRQRIDLRRRPLYLLLGSPAGGAAGLVPALHALHRGDKVLVVPEQDSPAPFRLLVCDEAAYLLWTGAGAPPADGPGPGLDAHANPLALSHTVLWGSAAHVAPASTDELRYLCELVTAARGPRAPVNGIALLLPWDGLAEEPAADALAEGHAAMLATARDALGLACPVFAVVCDLERAVGYREFVAALGEDQAGRRLGFTMPWLRRPDPDEVRALLDGGLAWLIDGEAARAVYAAMVRAVLDDPAQSPGRNGRLFRFLGQLRRRRSGLRLGLARLAGVLLDGADWPLFGGFYFAGTGAGPGEQAFLPGVLHRLNASCDYLAWRGPRSRRSPWAWLPYLLSGAAVAAGVGALLWHYCLVR